MDYMPVDPMAPADSPLHPSQVAKARQQGGDSVYRAAEELQHLIDKHRTPAEIDAQQVPDLAELNHRQEMVAAALQDEPVTFTDLTGTEYRWAVTEDDPGHWERVEPPAPEVPETPPQGSAAGPTPPTTGDKTPADLDAALAALNAVKGK